MTFSKLINAFLISKLLLACIIKTRLLYLIKFADYGWKIYGPLEMRVDKETCKEQWIVESTNVLQHPDKGIDVSLIDIVLLVNFEVLFEEYTLTGALSIVWSKIFIMRAREEVILHYVWEDTEEVVLKLQYVLLNERLEDHWTTWSERYPDVVKKVVDGILVVWAIEIVTDDNLLYCELLKPPIEVLLCRACNIWWVTSWFWVIRASQET